MGGTWLLPATGTSPVGSDTHHRSHSVTEQCVASSQTSLKTETGLGRTGRDSRSVHFLGGQDVVPRAPKGTVRPPGPACPLRRKCLSWETGVTQRSGPQPHATWETRLTEAPRRSWPASVTHSELQVGDVRTFFLLPLGLQFSWEGLPSYPWGEQTLVLTGVALGPRALSPFSLSSSLPSLFLSCPGWWPGLACIVPCAHVLTCALGCSRGPGVFRCFLLAGSRWPRPLSCCPHPCPLELESPMSKERVLSMGTGFRIQGLALRVLTATEVTPFTEQKKGDAREGGLGTGQVPPW